MLRLVLAGLVAGGFQVVVVVIVTGVLLSLSSCGEFPSNHSNSAMQAQTSVAHLAPLAAWIDVLAAFGVVLTRNRFLELTAQRIRQAARRLNPIEPVRATKMLLVQLAIVSIGLAALAFRPSPHVLTELASTLGCGAAASMVWPSLMSIGAAAFGANAHAAARALR